MIEKIKNPNYVVKLDFEDGHAAAAAKSLQSCPTLCDPIDGSPPGSSIHRILQAIILEWVAISFSKDGHTSQIKTYKNFSNNACERTIFFQYNNVQLKVILSRYFRSALW